MLERNPRSPTARSASQPSFSSASAAAGSPAIISMRPAWPALMAESIAAPHLVCADWARVIAARASAKRPA